MKADATVVYYSSNRESELFELAIMRQLLDASGSLPLVIVSHKPMFYGHNICVGNVGLSNVNVFRQMMIGIEAAKTKYIITAESDQLHPKEFFKFRPPDDSVMYAGMPLYILSAKRGKRRSFCAKERGCEGAMIASRDLALKYLKQMLKGQPQWLDHPGRDVPMPFLFNLGPWREFKLPKAIISFRTANQLHTKTPWLVGSERRELPHWGNANDLIEKYIGIL